MVFDLVVLVFLLLLLFLVPAALFHLSPSRCVVEYREDAEAAGFVYDKEVHPWEWVTPEELERRRLKRRGLTACQKCMEAYRMDMLKCPNCSEPNPQSREAENSTK